MKRSKFCQLLGFGLTMSATPISVLSMQEKALLNVLILGDSISIGYTPFVRKILKGKALISRPMKNDDSAENCAGTTNGIQHIDRWLGETNWDVIHFNFGLHDIKHVDPLTGKNSKKLENPRQAEPKQYKKNLKEITAKLKATGAKLIFATTTPYPQKLNGPLREYGDAETYNKIARKIMKKNKIQVNDLHAYVLPRMKELQRPNNVHFTETGSKKLAEQVAKYILAK